MFRCADAWGWQMPAKTKAFDCVEMKNAIQERMERDTAAMSDAERRAYFAERAEEFRRRSVASQHRTLAEILEMARQ